jgi:hypothetical protein
VIDLIETIGLRECVVNCYKNGPHCGKVVIKRSDQRHCQTNYGRLLGAARLFQATTYAARARRSKGRMREGATCAQSAPNFARF